MFGGFLSFLLVVLFKGVHRVLYSKYKGLSLQGSHNRDSYRRSMYSAHDSDATSAFLPNSCRSYMRILK